ncbi:MAG: HAD family phosphatase [Clostridia bacterium]|nr:HAD family phosphatase [Clostridia bacterium]
MESSEKTHGSTRAVKAVLFDLDGTLTDTEIYFREAWIGAAAEYGYYMSPERELLMRSLGMPYVEEQFKAWYGGDCPFPEIAGLCGRIFASLAEERGVRLKPGVKETLIKLKEMGITVALTTSGRTGRASAVLSKAGILDLFDRMICSNMVKRGKPAPDTYLYACGELGIEPREAIAVEDSPNGVKSAYAAGCRVIMVPDLSEPDDEIKPMLYARVDTVDGIIGYLD